MTIRLTDLLLAAIAVLLLVLVVNFVPGPFTGKCYAPVTMTQPTLPGQPAQPPTVFMPARCDHTWSPFGG